MVKKWIAFFSQTGSELKDLSKELDVYPDLIVLNKDWGNTNINPELRSIVESRHIPVFCLPSKPTLEDYESLKQLYSDIFKECFITLHGYLRIIPAEWCSSLNIYNGHPGLITEYPELRGFNPQEKAFNLKLKDSGCVIHEVTAEVDCGNILLQKKCSIENLSLDEVYETLHKCSVELWIDFFKSTLLK